MAKRYVHNPGSGVAIVGGVLIPPGEGREVEDEALGFEDTAAAGPAAAAADGDEAALAAVVAGLLEHPLKQLLPLLPDLPDDTLAQLAEAEGLHEAPRKTLLAAIGEMQLERAQVKTGALT